MAAATYIFRGGADPMAITVNGLVRRSRCPIYRSIDPQTAFPRRGIRLSSAHPERTPRPALRPFFDSEM
jgi:hypothetical protein